MNPRSVLVAIAIVTAGLPAAVVCGQAGTQPGADRPGFTFAAISDTHIASAEELGRFRAFLFTIGQERGDFLLLLGDICGHAPEYLPQIRNVIDHSGLKVYPIPGNHDDNYGRNPEWYSAAFPQSYYAFDHKGWRFVMNDSQAIVNARRPAPLEWLRKEMASRPAGQPVVYCQHYPPTASRPGQTDPAPDPWEAVQASANVKVALAGHEHRRSTYTLSGLDCEVLENCFFTGEPDAGSYCILEALPDGRVRIQEHPLAGLQLREPPDKTPTVQIDSPDDGAILRGKAVFRGKAADDEAVKKVEYSVDLGTWRPAEGTGRWRFSLDTKTLTDAHYIFRVRAIDSAGQFSIATDSVLAMVENEPPRNETVFRFQQGRNGYAGCRDVTVRRFGAPKAADGHEGEAGDLECWYFRTGRGEVAEFNEFYIRFDLSKSPIPKDARVKRAALTLYGSRQNMVDPAGQQCGYVVGVLGEAFKPGMTFADRPGKPGWSAASQPAPKPDLTGTWPYPGGRQLVVPPQPVVIDLTPLKDRVEGWLRDPASNHGLVFSPAAGRNYNMSAKGSSCRIVTLRPRLEVEIAAAP